MRMGLFRMIGMFIFVAITIALWSCKKGDFIVSGVVNGSEVGNVIMVDDNNNVLDSTDYNKGTFSLCTHLDQERFISIKITDSTTGKCLVSSTLSEDKPMHISFDFKSFEINRTGDDLHQEYLKYLYYMHDLPQFEHFRKLNRFMICGPSGTVPQKAIEIRKEMDLVRDSIISSILELEDGSRRSRAAAALIWDEFSHEGHTAMKYAVSLFDKDFKDSYYLEKLRKIVKK